MNRTHFWLRAALFALVSSTLSVVIEGGINVTTWVSTFGALFAFTVVLALISSGLRWTLLGRAGSLFLLVLGVMVVNVGVELLIFSTTSRADIMRFVAGGSGLGAICAVVLAWLFPPRNQIPGWPDFIEQMRRRSMTSWSLRIMSSVLAYILLYFIVGAAAFQFTRPYYTDPSYGLELSVPSLSTILLAQCVRAPIFVLSLWPTVAGAAYRRRRVALLAGMALFVLGGLTPLLAESNWPPELRFFHTVEIFFQNATTGVIIGWLFARNTRSADPLSGHTHPVVA